MKLNYPLKFKPILKERIWGGEKLSQVLNKESESKCLGESWEISDVKNESSIVENGKLKGKSLKELLSIYKDQLVGKKVYRAFGDKFPLLIKFIDAKEALSIQLHPDDNLAKSRHNSFGKTEMWYIMQADPEGNLVVGFKKDSSKEEYLEHLQKKSLLKILNVENVAAGDVYFIPTGRVHAIGAGVLLAEIQQTSDITYRIYDWDRTDEQGNSRDLHTELALDAIDYTAESIYKTTYTKNLNKGSKIIDCQYFTTNIIQLNNIVKVNNKDRDSFVIYMCVEGGATLAYNEGRHLEIKQGETLLVPATLKEFELKTKDTAVLLEVYIKK